MHCGTTLIAYKQLIEATPLEWLGSVKVLLGLPKLAFCTRPEASSFPAVSQLDAGNGRISCLVIPEPIKVSVINSTRPALVWVRSGVIRNQPDVFMVPAHESICIVTDQITALTIVQFPESDSTAEQSNDLTAHQQQQVRWLLEHYLLASRYFPDHKSALQNTRAMVVHLKDCLTTQRLELVLPRQRIVDPKVERVVQFIRGNKDWEFNLQDLSALAHTSERTLYNRMKRAIGLTPYRYYQRCKLLRLRNALLQCDSDSPSISWHALEHGFTHLGRLPALYMNHFGEKPSETLARRKRLKEKSMANSRHLQRQSILS